MKHPIKRIGLFSLLALICLALLASKALATTGLDIGWWSMDAGGSTSSDGVYSLSGTIGQPDAGQPMSNGQFSMDGGFWSYFPTLSTSPHNIYFPVLTRPGIGP